MKTKLQSLSINAHAPYVETAASCNYRCNLQNCNMPCIVQRVGKLNSVPLLTIIAVIFGCVLWIRFYCNHILYSNPVSCQRYGYLP
jgi:hypothetical protein